MTLAHMGGLHGLAVVWPPLVLVIGLWLATRISKEEPRRRRRRRTRRRTTEESVER